MSRRLAAGTALVAALSILATIPSPIAAKAAPLPRRLFQAVISGGQAGPTGAVNVTVNTNNTGTLDATITTLQPSTTYALAVYQGTCAQPRIVAKLPGLKTDATGFGKRTATFAAKTGSAIWSAASAGSLAIRVSAGSDVHCAPLTFPTATRIAIPGLGIDLPVVIQRGNAFPYCNVAMYLSWMSQPGEPGPTFIYAHARAGMFLPLLNASTVANGKSLIGKTVRVWTSGNLLHTYKITDVRRHQYVFPSFNPASEQLWLQTSEGPYGTDNKLIVMAKPVSTVVSTASEAQPQPHPVKCGLYG